LLGPLRDIMQDGLESLRQAGVVEAKGVQYVNNIFMAEPYSPTWSRLWALVALGHWLDRNKVTERTQPIVVVAGGGL